MSIDQAEKDEKEEQKAEMNFRFTLIEELRGIRRALEPKEQLVCKQIMNDGLTCNTRYEKVLDLLEVSKAERNMFAKELKIATDALQEATNSELRWTKKYEEAGTRMKRIQRSKPSTHQQFVKLNLRSGQQFILRDVPDYMALNNISINGSYFSPSEAANLVLEVQHWLVKGTLRR